MKNGQIVKFRLILDRPPLISAKKRDREGRFILIKTTFDFEKKRHKIEKMTENNYHDILEAAQRKTYDSDDYGIGVQKSVNP